MEDREFDILVARALGWQIETRQVPDIASLHKAARTIPLYEVVDASGTKWSPCHNLDDVGLLHYSLCYDASLNAAKELGLFGMQDDGLDVVLYRAADEWQICGIDWPSEELVVIATADTVPLAVCRAIVALVKENEQ